MQTKRRKAVTLTLCSLLAIGAGVFAGRNAAAQGAPKISFFITSAGPGDGANLGGVAGADKHCQRLAGTVGAGDRTWRAYLSTTGDGKQAAVNARDRIGKGPWYNAKGVVAAQNVADLHSDKNKLSKEVSLSEKGEMINGRGDTPNRHDVLTGSQADGAALAGIRRLPPAATGRATDPGAHRWATTIDRAAARARLRGMPHTCRKAAARRTCRGPAAMGSSTVSRNNDAQGARGRLMRRAPHIPARTTALRGPFPRLNQAPRFCGSRQQVGHRAASRRSLASYPCARDASSRS